MVTASHAHDNQAHNCFIDNYVHNNITFDNKPSKNRGQFNYYKIQSESSSKESSKNAKDMLKADVIYNIILESLKL